MNFTKSWVLTKDGSSTLKINSLKETYHSLHGAVTESEFVYVTNGLHFWHNAHPNSNAAILEMGYGTGLLSYVNFLDHLKTQIKIDYTSIEAYPLSLKELGRLNYNRFFDEKKAFLLLSFQS